jgi:hypothetical protein
VDPAFVTTHTRNAPDQPFGGPGRRWPGRGTSACNFCGIPTPSSKKGPVSRGHRACGLASSRVTRASRTALSLATGTLHRPVCSSGSDWQWRRCSWFLIFCTLPALKFWPGSGRGIIFRSVIGPRPLHRSKDDQAI